MAPHQSIVDTEFLQEVGRHHDNPRPPLTCPHLPFMPDTCCFMNASNPYVVVP